MKVLNLFGSPGSGKSTTAAGLFHKMKTLGYDVELVTEVAKDLVWSKRFKCLENQPKVSIDQYERLRRLEGQVDYVITDSPLLLGLFYTPEDYFETFTPFLFQLFNSFDNYNIFIKRESEYNSNGRMQTEKESNLISIELENMLRKHNYKYVKFDGTKAVVTTIYNKLIYEQII